jgi:hypothetical protein
VVFYCKEMEELLKKKARLEEDLREDKYPQPHLF